MTSIKSKAATPAVNQRRSFAKKFARKDPRINLKPIALRELPHWLLAMTFVILSASDFRSPWILDEPLEHFSQPTEENFPVRLAKFNFRWLLKGAAHAAQIREEKARRSLHQAPYKPRTPSAIETC